MSDKPSTTLPATVEKIIKSPSPSVPDKAQIAVEGADPGDVLPGSPARRGRCGRRSPANVACAVQRFGSSRGCETHPATLSFQPEAAEVAMEVTKSSKPLVKKGRSGDSASLQAVT